MGRYKEPKAVPVKETPEREVRFAAGYGDHAKLDKLIASGISLDEQDVRCATQHLDPCLEHTFFPFVHATHVDMPAQRQRIRPRTLPRDSPRAQDVGMTALMISAMRGQAESVKAAQRIGSELQ